MNGALTASVSIELDKAIQDVKRLQNQIRELENQILKTRKAKLDSADDKKAVAQYNKELQDSSIKLKEKRLALRDATEKLKIETAANREATKAQQQFTQAVSTSAQGMEAITSVFQKFILSVADGESKLKALQQRLLDLRRLRFSDILNSADQKVLAKKIFEVTNEIRNEKTALSQLASEAKKAEQATKQLSSAQQQFRNQAGASNAVALEFNRIIQDAPFGIIGIGNNIQQLAGNFSALRASAGGTGAAISGALASILSPANLVLLGISAVTSAFTAYQLGLFDSKEETKEFVSETDRLNEAINNLLKQLSAVNSARLEGAKSAQDELAELELLNNVLNDASKSEFERARVFDILLQKYPRIIGNMTAEQALAKGLGSAYKSITQAILERASATAVEEKLTDVLKRRLDLVQKESSETSKQNDLLQKRDEIFQKIAKSLESTGEGFSFKLPSIDQIDKTGKTLFEIFGPNKIPLEIKELGKELINVNKEFTELGNTIALQTTNEIQNADNQIQQLKSEYQGLSQGLIALLDPLDQTAEKTNKLSKSQKGAEENVKLTRKEVQSLIRDLALYQGLLESIQEENFNAFNQIQTPQGGLQGNQGFVQQIQQQISAIEALRDASRDRKDIDDYNIQLGLLRDRLKTLTNQEEVESTVALTRALGDAFSAMAQQISASLNISNDSLKAFVGTLLTQTPKIIGAIAKTVAANRAASNEKTKLTVKEALANGILVGTEGAKALGPIGLALLPVFVGGAMALISGAFRKAGVNAPSGGATGSAVRSASMNTAGSSVTGMGTAFNPFGDMQLRTVIRGTNIELLLERVNQERRA
jgi:hypothetical protein